MRSIGYVLASLVIALPTLAIADPWKDESGHGRHRGAHPPVVVVPVPAPPIPYHPPLYVAPAPTIPHGHLPPPGECRVWYPDRPAGHQPPPHRC